MASALKQMCELRALSLASTLIVTCEFCWPFSGTILLWFCYDPCACVCAFVRYHSNDIALNPKENSVFHFCIANNSQFNNWRSQNVWKSKWFFTRTNGIFPAQICQYEFHYTAWSDHVQTYRGKNKSNFSFFLALTRPFTSAFFPPPKTTFVIDSKWV